MATIKYPYLDEMGSFRYVHDAKTGKHFKEYANGERVPASRFIPPMRFAWEWFKHGVGRWIS